MLQEKGHVVTLLGCSLLLASCATSKPEGSSTTAPPSVVAQGGDFSVLELPSQNTWRADDCLVVLAFVEVPGTSLLTATYAIVDAYVRVELQRLLGTQLVAFMEDQQTSQGTQKITFSVDEWVKGSLPALPALYHAWARLQRQDADIFRVAALLKITKETWVSSLATSSAIFSGSQEHREFLETQITALLESAVAVPLGDSFFRTCP